MSTLKIKTRLMLTAMFVIMIGVVSIGTNTWADVTKSCTVNYPVDAASDEYVDQLNPGSLNMALKELIGVDGQKLCQEEIKFGVEKVDYDHQVIIDGVAQFTLEGHANMTNIHFNDAAIGDMLADGSATVDALSLKCGVVINSSHVTIKNMAITDAQIGLCVFGDNVTIEDSVIANNDIGIYVANGADSFTIGKNVAIAANSKKGIYVDGKTNYINYTVGTDISPAMAQNGSAEDEIQIRTEVNIGFDVEFIKKDTPTTYKMFGRIFQCNTGTIGDCTNDGVPVKDASKCDKQIGRNPSKVLLFVSKQDVSGLPLNQYYANLKGGIHEITGVANKVGIINYQIDATIFTDATSFFLVAIDEDGGWSTSSRVYKLSDDISTGFDWGVCSDCTNGDPSCLMSSLADGSSDLGDEGDAGQDPATPMMPGAGGADVGFNNWEWDGNSNQYSGNFTSDYCKKEFYGMVEAGDSFACMTDMDSDKDGLLDHMEDLNCNCEVDDGETDAHNPDTDGDGIPDGKEVAADPTLGTYVECYEIAAQGQGTTQKKNPYTGNVVDVDPILPMVVNKPYPTPTSIKLQGVVGYVNPLNSKMQPSQVNGMQVAYKDTDISGYFCTDTIPTGDGGADSDQDGIADGVEDREPFFTDIMPGEKPQLYMLGAQGVVAGSTWNVLPVAIQAIQSGNYSGNFDAEGNCSLSKPIDYSNAYSKKFHPGREYQLTWWVTGGKKKFVWLVCQYAALNSSTNFNGFVDNQETDPTMPDTDSDGYCDGPGGGEGCQKALGDNGIYNKGQDMCPTFANVQIEEQNKPGVFVFTPQCMDVACYNNMWTFREDGIMTGPMAIDFIEKFENEIDVINPIEHLSKVNKLKQFSDVGDNDGVPNLIENPNDVCGYQYTMNLNPTVADSDGDGWCDGSKSGALFMSCTPNDPCLNDPTNSCVKGHMVTVNGVDVWEAEKDPKYGNYQDIVRESFETAKALYCILDFDGDGIVNCLENWDFDGGEPNKSIGETDPYKWDTDEDGLGDKVEIDGLSGVAGEMGGGVKLSPVNKDSDNDGIPDGLEIKFDAFEGNLINQDKMVTYNQSSMGTGVIHNGMDDNGTPEDKFDDRPIDYYLDTDPTLDDTDNDGLKDGVEMYITMTDPNHPDTDNDGAVDFCKEDLPEGIPCELKREAFYDPSIDVDATDPREADTDGDGLVDGVDIKPNTPFGFTGVSQCRKSATNNCQDLDGDMLCDRCEDEWFMQDGVTCQYDSANPDTDGDGINDGDEDKNANGKWDPGQDETDPCKIDTDGDGVADNVELGSCMNPANPDTDGDCIPDGIEDSNPMGSMSIGSHDGIYQAPFETDPCNPDTDGDGLWDGNINGTGEDLNCNGIWEYKIGETDPRNVDTDGDGRTDWDESCHNEIGALTCTKKHPFNGNVNRDALNMHHGCSLVADDRAEPNMILMLLMALPAIMIALVRLLKEEDGFRVSAESKKADR